MEREELIVLDSGIETDEVANRDKCCDGPSAPVR